MRRIYLVPLGIALALAMLVIIAFFPAGSRPTSQQVSSSTTGSYAATGKTGGTLVTPDGVAFTLVGTGHHGTEVLFHIKVYNKQRQQANIWNTDANHGFVLYNAATDAFVSAFTTPAKAELATHPALAHTVAGHASVDGWVAFNMPARSRYDSTLFYYYRLVHTVRCPNPSVNTSPCQPAILYSTVHWNY